MNIYDSDHLYGYSTDYCQMPSSSQLEAIKTCLEKKADPNIVNYGVPLLCYATAYKELSLIKLFLNSKADPNVKCTDSAPKHWQNKTPLDFAKLHKNDEMIKLLLDSKANA